jgi:molybdopterin-guanine dinucleotide biosynthesis protein A
VLIRDPNELFLRAHRKGDIGLDKALELLSPYYDILLLEGHKSTPLVDKVWLLKDEAEECPPEAVNIKRVLRRDEDRAGILMGMLIPWLIEKCLSTPVYAGILIGGNSHRMGRPKHLIKTSDGRTWVELIVSSTQPLAKQVAILGKGEIPKPIEHLPVFHDVEDAQGPLAGILAAMRWRPDVSWLFLSCDMPRIGAEAIRWLMSNRKPGVWAVMPRRTESEGVEPLPGWYDYRSRRLLETCRGPAALAGHEKVVTPLIPRELEAEWTNVNTISELKTVRPSQDDITRE